MNTEILSNFFVHRRSLRSSVFQFLLLLGEHGILGSSIVSYNFPASTSV